MTATTDHYFAHIFRQAKRLPPRSSYDALVCSTTTQVQDIQHRYQLPRPLFTIPVGIQNQAGAKHPLPVRARHHQQINCVTRVSPVEGILDTVRAFGLARRQLPDLQLNIYGKMGPLSAKFKKQLQKVQKQYALDRHSFRLHEYTYRVPELYRHSQLTLVTAPNDSFNISLLEALSQGCPAIVYNNNYGPRDMIINGYDGYQVDNDYRTMAKRIVYFFQHPRTMRQMSQHAYEEARRYSPERIWRQWQKLIRVARQQWPNKLVN